MVRIRDTFYKVPLAIFILFLFYLVLSFPFQYTKEAMSGVSLFARWFFACLFFVGAVCFWKTAQYWKKILRKKYFPIVLLISIIILQFIVIFVFKINPINDLLSLHDEAIRMLSDPKISMSSFNTYFARYSNNYGHLLLLYCYYKVLVFVGVSTSSLVLWGNILNIIVIDLGIVSTYFAIKQIKSITYASIAILLFFINPWTYFWVPYYYTHTISFGIVMISINLIVMAWYKEGIQKYISVLTLGIILYWGMKIRVTNLIVFIALVITVVFFYKRGCHKKIGRLMPIFLVGIIISLAAYQYKFGDMLPKNNQKAYPMTHWVMMASHGNGRYNYDDVVYTASFANKEDKVKANIKKIKQNYGELGIGGTLDLIGTKLKSVWLVGDDDFTKMSYSYREYSRANDFLNGEKSGWIIMYCYLLRILILIFLLVEACYLWKHPDKWSYLLMLILLGAMVFHNIWEANPKYSICFMGVMIMQMVFGMQNFYKKKKMKVERSSKTLISILILLLVSCFMKPTHASIGASPEVYSRKYSVYQMASSSPMRINLKQGDSVGQKFVAATEFQYIMVTLEEQLFDNQVKVMLFDDHGKVLFNEKIESLRRKNSNSILWKLPQKMGKGSYEIRFVNGGKQRTILLPAYSTGNYDVYAKGNMWIDNEEKAMSDLIFSVW